MTTVYRNRARTWRERLALRLIGTTPVCANVEIGPDFGSVRGRDGREILARGVAFDVSDYDREIAELLGHQEEAPKRRGASQARPGRDGSP